MNMESKGHRFPLSLSQRNIWDLERTFDGTSVNNISTTIRLQGRMDFVILQESIRMVLKADPSLRTRILWEDGELVQYHAPFSEEDFPVFDFSHTSSEGIESWEAAMTRETIPLTGGPLYRFMLFRAGENAGGVLVKIHHMISDGWSQVLICNRIGQTYLDLLAGKEPLLEEAPSYELHVEEERDYLTSKAYGRDERYWRDILEKSGEPSVLKSVKSAAVSPVGRRLSCDLPQVLNHAIYSYCLEKRVAPFAVFYMALAIYFKRIGGADRFTIGVPIFNRTNFLFKQSTGMFVTTLPFYNKINDEWTLDQFNEELAEAWFEMLRHQRFPFSHIEKLAGENKGQEGRLFHIALSYQDSKIVESRDASVMLSGRWHYSGYQSEQLCIHLTNLLDNKCYSVDYDYLTQFFAEAEIVQLHKSLCNILMEALSNPGKPIYQLAVLTAEERERVLYTFNRTDRLLEERSVYKALEESASDYPSRAAAIYGGERMTYEALLGRASDIACAVKNRMGEGRELAAVLLPRGFTLLESMAAILKAGFGYLLLSPELPEGRIRNILERSGAGILLTDRENRENFGQPESPVPVICVEDIGRGTVSCSDPSLKEELRDPDRLAYVVYTSGSTGEPKGVEITQRNLLNLSQAMRHVYGKGAVLSVCNVGFDAFMLESIVALLNGKTIVLPEEEELESPRRLAGLITGYAVGFFSMTPSRLSVLLKDSAFCGAMRRMESIVCGGEAFPADLLKKLKNVSHARIYNQYGPSETTVGVSIKELSHAARITAGRPMDNCRLYVLDKWMNPLPAGVYGQLYVGGTCVGRGYRNQPELTKESFLDNPFENGEKMYYTGDSACWTADGEIVLSGRLDKQVKLRGLRIEPQEVAACIASYPGVKTAASRVCEINGQMVLLAYYCSEERIPETELLAFAATYLPRYMIPSYVMRLEEIPTNGNGKVEEEKLPLPGERGEESFTAPVSAALLQDIVDIFREVLSREEMGPDSDYFLSGGNSLNAMETITAMEDKTGFTIRVADLYACRTARRLTAYLNKTDGRSEGYILPAEGKRIEKAPDREWYPLSPMQQGIYVQSYLDSTGLSYNMPGAFRLSEKPDLERLEKAFRQLIRQDAVFRTSFIQEAGGVHAHIEKEVPFSLTKIEALCFEEACGGFLKPFDLSRAPLLRAGVWKSQEQEWFLLLDSHHIIGDGLSTPLVLKRLNEAYCGKETKMSLSYHDYAYALSAETEEESREEQEYWKEHLQNLPEPLTLPADFVRSREFDFRGREYQMEMPEPDSLACENYCMRHGISVFTLFLAAYGLLLSRISGREDFTVGAPVAGRVRPGTQDICGPFINTLPLRLRPEKKKAVSTYLEEIRTEVAGMLDHQQISLEEIITMLGLPRGTQNPLYQLMLTQSPVDESAFVLDGKSMEFRPISTGAVKMDMVVELSKKRDAYILRFSYASSLFLEETVRYYGRCLKRILQELCSERDLPLGEVPVLSAEDYEKYVETPNYLATPFVNLPIHRMIENKIKTMPDSPAVWYHGTAVTMREIERRACGLAAMLREEGAEPGQRIGLCMGRTPDMIAAMFGILKAGCAYVPMLPSFPEARLVYMLETSGAVCVLCDEEALRCLPGQLPCRKLLASERTEEQFTDAPVSSEDLVNVLFTSGSTGKPKGVMLRHRSISNLYGQMRELLEPITGPVLCSTNSIFDCFIVETLFPLAMGKLVVLADEEEMMLPWKLAELINRNGVEIFEMTPSRLQMCLGNEAFCRAASGLRIVLLGGEVLTKRLLAKFYEVSEGTLMNMYGPTEATVFTTMAAVRPGDTITVGRPLNNTRVYVLDEDMRPVMPTGCGELYIAGECLAGGYISRPDLTEASFLPDLYFPGERMYRSGDIVRLRLDGTYDFIGRADAQVKLNGQRVELDEITGALLDSGFAGQAATVAVRKDDGSMELCSFYQPAAGKTDVHGPLMEYLRHMLPSYMVPSRVIPLETLPMTATSKTDMQTLKKMALEGLEHVQADVPEAPKAFEARGEKTPPSPEINEEFVLAIWNQVLSKKAEEPDVSFFEQGGTSLAALSVLSSYFNCHLEMSLAEFYANPTARQQAELLRGSVGGGKERTQLSSEAEASDQEAEFARVVFPVREPEKRFALITGATGFFGVHLLKALLDRGEEEIICLMRDGDKERLLECLSWYFGRGVIMRERRRISVVKGDLSKERLGLSDRDYRELAGRVGEIFHGAADVRHYAADAEAFLKTNVGGTEQMLALAREAGARFYHMSTCSVSGEYLKDGRKEAVFTENDYDIGQIWEDNIYVKSKFLAEGLVLEAIHHGLPAKIFRLGRLVGRASDGVFQRNPDTNAFYLLMRAFHLVGAIPRTVAKTEVDLTPIDYCAEAVLALLDSEGSIFHIMNPDPPLVEAAAKALEEEIYIVPDETFTHMLAETVKGPYRELVSTLIDFWHHVRLEPPVIQVSNKKTKEQLDKAGFRFEIPEPGRLLSGFTLQDSWVGKGE
ncbi:amino acid adenylation domain-containing protein [Qiania dongpingensis]|uniref:Amino acid adenylation domain-containing protein n=2 Tax=Qiania dongpingensis TaxID=2763669 RepID=A0A7G9G7H0_9FIRM|nr:amino acid adenylation domain-containing protein [Qiania dongpingensis]